MPTATAESNIVSIEHIRSNQLPLVDVRNRFRSRTLFFEPYPLHNTSPDIYYPVWTLKSYDMVIGPEHAIYRPNRVNTLPSLRRLYLGCDDPTEYEFAHRYFGSWEHWQKIANTTWMSELLVEWRQELKTKIESEAIRTARRVAAGGEGQLALQAAKWLHGVLQPKNGRGRPSKAEIERQAKAKAEQERVTKEDGVRVGVDLLPHELEILEDEI